MPRPADHEIDPMLLARWSPRAMSGAPLSREELLRLLEAARWAPSSGNQQPEDLSERLRPREAPSGREPVAAFAFEGRFA